MVDEGGVGEVDEGGGSIQVVRKKGVFQGRRRID